MQRQDHLPALAQRVRYPLLGRVVSGLGPQPADGVLHGWRAERGHGDAEAVVAHLRQLAPVQAGHRGAQRGPVQPAGDRGVLGPGHEHRAERGEQRRPVARVADVRRRGHRPAPGQHDDVPPGDGDDVDLGAELPAQQLGPLGRRADGRMLVQGRHAGHGQGGPEHVGAVHRIAHHEAAVAEHGQRGVRGGDVHAQVPGELADREAAGRVGGEERDDHRRTGGRGGSTGHAHQVSGRPPACRSLDVNIFLL